MPEATMEDRPLAARRKAKPRPLPTFDPVPSAQFGLEILDRSKSRRALIGRVAMWYWLDDEADHEYTKDVDFAVPQVSIPLDSRSPSPNRRRGVTAHDRRRQCTNLETGSLD